MDVPGWREVEKAYEKLLLIERRQCCGCQPKKEQKTKHIDDSAERSI